MAVETGVLEWLKWDTQAGEVWKSPGLITGGTLFPSGYNATVRRGAGNQGSFHHGPTRFRCAPQLEVTADSKPLMVAALRVGGVLPALKFWGGTAAYDFKMENAKINSMRVSGAVDEPMTVALEIVGPMEAEAAVGGAVAALTSELLPWSGASVALDAPYNCQGFEAGVNNNLQEYFDLDAKAATTKRLPTGITQGWEEIVFRGDFLLKQAWDIGADAPPVNIGATVIYTNGTTTITQTFTNLTRTGTRALPVQRESGLVVWAYEFLGKPGALVIT
jgi:hypothetical protein